MLADIPVVVMTCPPSTQRWSRTTLLARSMASDRRVQHGTSWPLGRAGGRLQSAPGGGSGLTARDRRVRVKSVVASRCPRCQTFQYQGHLRGAGRLAGDDGSELLRPSRHPGLEDSRETPL